MLPKPCLELTSSSKPKRRDKLPPESNLFDRLIGYFSMALVNFSTAGPDFDKLINVEKLYISYEQQMTHDTNIWKSMASSIYITRFTCGVCFMPFLKLFCWYFFFQQLKKYINPLSLASKKESPSSFHLAKVTRTWKII